MFSHFLWLYGTKKCIFRLSGHGSGRTCCPADGTTRAAARRCVVAFERNLHYLSRKVNEWSVPNLN